MIYFSEENQVRSNKRRLLGHNPSHLVASVILHTLPVFLGCPQILMLGLKTVCRPLFGQCSRHEHTDTFQKPLYMDIQHESGLNYSLVISI